MRVLDYRPIWRMLVTLTYSDYIHTPEGTRQRDLLPTCVYDAAYLRYYSEIDAHARQLSARRLDVLEAFVPQQGRLLDFGAGTFRFVEVAHASGWDAFGFDVMPSEHQRRMAVLDHGPWDVVTFFDSLEHLIDPQGAIGRLNSRTVMISVPECHRPEDQAWFMAWRHRKPGEHLWSWNRQTLTAMMGRFGYHCVMVSNFEDEFRTPYDPLLTNILTAIYRRK